MEKYLLISIDYVVYRGRCSVVWDSMLVLSLAERTLIARGIKDEIEALIRWASRSA
jgi:hypothetical protein